MSFAESHAAVKKDSIGFTRATAVIRARTPGLTCARCFPSDTHLGVELRRRPGRPMSERRVNAPSAGRSMMDRGNDPMLLSGLQGKVPYERLQLDPVIVSGRTSDELAVGVRD
jgi:hypothetical protein